MTDRDKNLLPNRIEQAPIGLLRLIGPHHEHWSLVIEHTPGLARPGMHTVEAEAEGCPTDQHC